MDDFPHSPQRRESETYTREQIQNVKLLTGNTLAFHYEKKTDTMI